MGSVEHIAETGLRVLEICGLVLLALLSRSTREHAKSAADRVSEVSTAVAQSLRPPPLLCAQCAHPLGKHAPRVDRNHRVIASPCSARYCSCPSWGGPLEFESDDPTPVTEGG